MQQKHVAPLAARVVQLLANDTLSETSRKLAFVGVTVSPAAISKWKNGGNITDANIDALARVYKTTPEWIKYGTGPRQTLSESQEAAAELANDPAIHEELEAAIEFLRFRVQRNPLLSKDPAVMARYFRLMDAITKTPKAP